MQLATWAQTLPVILMIVLAVYLPGSIVGLLAGRRGVDLVALAPVISIAIAGVGGVVVYPLGVRWGWGAYLLGAALVALVVFATRTALAHVRGQSHAWWPGESAALRPAGTAEVTSAAEPTGSVRGRLSWLPATTGVAVALTTIAVRFIRAVPSPDQVTQNYDSVFHDNIVARIIITGEASSLHALPPIRDVYPIAFQQFAALGALAVPHTTATAAVTAAWLVFAALIWPCSMLFVVRRVCGAHPLTDVLGPALSAVCAGFPFLLVDWGTLYSMFAGQVVLPVFLGLAWTWCRDTWARGARAAWSGLGWVAVAAIAVSVCHFRVMMTGMLLLVPVLLVWAYDALRTVRQRSKVAFRSIVILAALAVAGVLALGVRIFANMYLRGNSRPIADHLNGGPAQPTENLLSAVLRYALGQPINAANQRMAVYWPVAVLVLAALLLTLVVHSRESLMLAGSFVLLGFVFVSSAGTHADWAKVVTALWYKDQRRLFAAWPIVAIALICWAARYLCDRYGQADFVRLPTHGLLRNAAWAVALLVVLAACTVNPQLDGMQRSVAGTYAFAADNSDNPMLSDDEYLLLKRIGRSVPEHEQVISDPWNGSGFLLAVGWRTPFYPHLSMMWDHDHDYLARNLHAIDTDPEVCAIIRRNDLHWYLDMGGSFAPNDPQHAMFTGMRAVPDAMQAVDRQGRAMLYRITACWAGE